MESFSLEGDAALNTEVGTTCQLIIIKLIIICINKSIETHHHRNGKKQYFEKSTCLGNIIIMEIITAKFSVIITLLQGI